jgi:hypothetical protein
MNISIRRTILASFAIAAAGVASGAEPQTTAAQNVKVVNVPRVIVTNTHDKPVPVYDVRHSDPGEQFFLEVTAGLNRGATAIGTVPADRRYVVEHVSALCSSIPAAPLFVARISLLTAAGARNEHVLVASPLINIGTGVGVTWIGTPMTFEAGPGALLSFTGDTFNAGTVGGSCGVTVSGRSYPL